jgi:hypothetical protein
LKSLRSFAKEKYNGENVKIVIPKDDSIGMAGTMKVHNQALLEYLKSILRVITVIPVMALVIFCFVCSF